MTRQPMLRGVEVRVPADGLPDADDVMERGVLLPLSHALDDDTLDFVIDQVGRVPDAAVVNHRVLMITRRR